MVRYSNATSGRHFLQIPGPTNVPDRILRAIDHPTIDHRGPEFNALAKSNLHAKPVQTKSHLLHLCRYIHGNPVKDGLVADPADWPYSNYLEWIGERDGAHVDRDFIKNQFGNAEEYKKFLFEYLKSRQLPEDVKKFLDDLEK